MTIVRLGAGEREEVVELLATAFHDYPVMRFTLGRPSDYRARLRALVGFYADRRLLSGWPVLGIREADRLVAAMLVSEPPPSAEGPGVAAALARLRASLGEDAFDRMSRFERASDENEPPTRHYFVGMIGVAPDRRGRGLARTLLDHIAGEAAARGYDGVALSTEDPANLAIYRRLGFEIVAEDQVDTLRTWCLFRPCPAMEPPRPAR